MEMDDRILALEREFCPPIDPALFSAIISDYRGHENDPLEEARATLEALKVSAAIEENTDFDPSGTSGQAHLNLGTANDVFDAGQPLSEMIEEEVNSTSRSEGTDPTSLTQSLTLISLDGDSGSEIEARAGRSQGQALLEALDTPGQEGLLKEMFPKVNTFTISHALKKANGNFSRALEDLLNQAYFDDGGTDGEETVTAKGIEAFADYEPALRGRKGKGKKKRWRSGMGDDRRASSLPAPSSSKAMNCGTNPWELGKSEIDFIVSRTTLAPLPVSTVYRQNGGSLSATLHRLLEIESRQTPSVFSEKPEIQAKAFELGQDFPKVPSAHLVTLIYLTHPSTAAAHELAKALITEAPPKPPTGGLQIITRYSPIDLDSSRPSPKARSPANANLSLSAANAAAASHNLARQAAFTQASAAYRRGRSDHLMGGAAAYYSSVGRDFEAKAKAYGAAAADALVSSQSSQNALDLHGVHVKDAVRIAEERISTWWASLGDTRYTNGARQGREYRIITGVGNHSEGGRSRIGPAVEKMLEGQGWQYTRGEGVLVVTGFRRNRR